MKQVLTLFFSIGITLIGFTQQEFHVFPKDHNKTPGTQNGTGSVHDPWDLQTALNQTADVVNSGDTIWLHEGIYNGRFVSTLQSLEANSYITVSAFNTDKVVINGNVDSPKKHVLEVNGKQVRYKNFEITFLGDFSRNAKYDDFKVVTGLRHFSGEDCQFLNLKIYNIPGTGLGSWKETGGSIIDGCVIYNNGYISTKGRGVGLYTQNSSEKTKVIQNCIIFNNYYKGIEVWSDNKKAKHEYVKNYEIKNNVVFNNGSPARQFKDNLIIGSGDKNGINIAKNMKVLTNIFYHNTDVKNSEINGDAASLTLGYKKESPVENITVKDNIIIGRNNALRILHAKSLTFEGNKVYSGYVALQSSVLETINNWRLKNNSYYTKKSSSFRISGDKDYNLKGWQSDFGLDEGSTWKSINQFDMREVVSINKYQNKAQAYKVVLFQKEGRDVSVNFSKSDLKTGLNYRIYDVENPNVIVETGKLPEDLKITFPMHLTDFEKPLHNKSAQKTLSNFGVFVIEFEAQSMVQVSEEKGNIFKRFFKWLGF